MSWLEVDAPDNGTVARAQVHATLALVALGRELLMERRDTPDEGSGHVICNRLYNEAKDRYDAAIARAETAERKLAVRTIDRDVCFEACKKVCAERDAERERAGRLEVRIAKLRRCLERFTASGSWLPDLGRTWAAFALSEDDAALALPASDTKEDA